MKTGYPKVLKSGEKFCPKTSTKLVYDEKGLPLSYHLENFNSQITNLSTLRLCIFGDGLSLNSYGAVTENADDAFAGLLASHFRSCTNVSIGNTIISDVSETSVEVLSYVERLGDLPDADTFDVLMVFATSNDWAYSSPIGENSDTDRFTYKGALQIVINHLLSKYFDKTIIFVTPLQSYNTEVYQDTTPNVPLVSSNEPNGVNKRLYDYAEAIKEICAINAIPVIDMYGTCGISYPNSAAQRLYLSDQNRYNVGIIPNSKGCYMIYKRLLKALTDII
jgi:hypothetical protein